MTPAVVVDIGNSRIKFGLCHGGRVVDAASLDPDDPADWLRPLRNWHLDPPAVSWAVAGVHPARLTAFCDWVARTGGSVELIDDPAQVPIAERVHVLKRVGLDRLLNRSAPSRTTMSFSFV